MLMIFIGYFWSHYERFFKCLCNFWYNNLMSRNRFRGKVIFQKMVGGGICLYSCKNKFYTWLHWLKSFTSCIDVKNPHILWNCDWNFCWSLYDVGDKALSNKLRFEVIEIILLLDESTSHTFCSNYHVLLGFTLISSLKWPWIPGRMVRQQCLSSEVDWWTLSWWSLAWLLNPTRFRRRIKIWMLAHFWSSILPTIESFHAMLLFVYQTIIF